MKDVFDPRRACWSLIDHSFVEVSTPSIQRLVGAIQNGYTRMIDRDSRRDKFMFSSECYPRDELGEELEFGLMRRQGGAKDVLSEQEIAEGRSTYDRNKWVFHYCDELMVALKEEVQLLSDYQAFFAACARLHQRAKAYALLTAQAFDSMPHAYPGSLEAKVRDARVYTRLLRYEYSPKSTPDAGFHRDRSAFTVHWYSSHPGLLLLDRYMNTVTGGETDPRRILLFPGLKYWIATRGHYGTGTIHGVRDIRPKQKGDVSVPRFALVSFVHATLTQEDLEFMRANKHALRLDKALVNHVL
jgi:hypothetical protein